jgi:chromosome segregation ATPase
MTLDEAIEHAEEVATTRCGECAEEHMQLAEWLRELKRLKAQTAQMGEVIGQMAHDHAEQGREITRLERENAKLRDLIADMSKAFFALDIDHCQACPRDKASRRCQMFATTDWECAFVTEMRKLGIEATK